MSLRYFFLTQSTHGYDPKVAEIELSFCTNTVRYFFRGVGGKGRVETTCVFSVRTYLFGDERRSLQRAQFQLKHTGQSSFYVQRPRNVAGLALELLHPSVLVGATERQRDPRKLLLCLGSLELFDLTNNKNQFTRDRVSGYLQYASVIRILLYNRNPFFETFNLHSTP